MVLAGLSGPAASEGGALEPSPDAASGAFCHFRRCRNPTLLLLQVKGRMALLNIYNHLRTSRPRMK